MDTKFFTEFRNGMIGIVFYPASDILNGISVGVRFSPADARRLAAAILAEADKAECAAADLALESKT